MGDEDAEHGTEQAPGFSSTRNVAAMLEDDLRQAFDPPANEQPSTGSATPTLTALARVLRENPSVRDELARRVENALDREGELDSVDDVLDALLEVGLQTAAPQYAVVLQDARTAAESDS